MHRATLTLNLRYWWISLSFQFVGLNLKKQTPCKPIPAKTTDSTHKLSSAHVGSIFIASLPPHSPPKTKPWKCCRVPCWTCEGKSQIVANFVINFVVDLSQEKCQRKQGGKRCGKHDGKRCGKRCGENSHVHIWRVPILHVGRSEWVSNSFTCPFLLLSLLFFLICMVSPPSWP